MNYTLKLLPTDTKSITQSKRKVMEDTQRFISRRLGRVIYEKENLDNGEIIFMKDLLDTRFWGALHQLDGAPYNSHNHLLTPEICQKQALQARQWAQEHFTKGELGDLLNIIVNQALTKPLETNWPGTERGHSILYCDLVDKENSMFASAVTPEFKKQLNNGRFWEELSDVQAGLNHGVGIQIVYEVLMHHYDDLDPEFAPQGIKMMALKSKNRKSLEHIRLHHLEEKGMEKYVSFVGKIDEAAVTNAGDIELLLQPYFPAVLRWDNDRDSPYYDGQKDWDEVQRGHFQEKLQIPVIQKYLAFSDYLRKQVAKDLAEGVPYQEDKFGDYARFMQDVLTIVPEGKKLMKQILTEVHADAGLRFFAKGKEHGYDLFAFLD